MVWHSWPLQQQDLYIWLNNTVSGLLTLDLIFELYLLLLSNSVDINLTVNNMTQPSVDTAFDNIRQAEIAGADVSNLVERFNYALELLHQGQISSSNKSCSSYTNCVADAQEIFSQITNESASYREHAGRGRRNRRRAPWRRAQPSRRPGRGRYARRSACAPLPPWSNRARGD